MRVRVPRRASASVRRSQLKPGARWAAGSYSASAARHNFARIPVHATVPGLLVQRQPKGGGQSTTEFDDTAKSIVRGAQNEKRDPGVRAVELVWRIIHEYYSGKAMSVTSVAFDNEKAGSGLATEPNKSKDVWYGKIYVGDEFLESAKKPANFARKVLQVGHELEHIDQYRSGMVGDPKQDEREFLAFYHEALATEVPHTGRFQHGTRILVIDAALGYYNCLDAATEKDKKEAAKNHIDKQKELLSRRQTEIAEMTKKGLKDVPTDPAPSACKRQSSSKKEKKP